MTPFDLTLSVAIFALVFDMTLAVYLAKRAKLGSLVDKVEGYIDEWRNSGGLDQYIFEQDGQWVMDERIGHLIDAVGSRIALSMRQAAYQAIGVDQKLQHGVDKAVGSDILNGSGIGGILDLLGMSETKKMLAKNPKTLGIIMSRLAPMLGQFMNKNSGQKGSSEFGWNP